MLYERKKLLLHRSLCFVLLLVSIIMTIILDGQALLFLFWLNIFLFMFFICSLLLSCKNYEYKGDDIVVYAGWFHHYIKVNGEKIDEHNTLLTYTAIYLSATLDDGTNMQATISMTNRISLKINDKLYTNTK